MESTKTIEGRIRHSKGALMAVIDLANENPFGKTSIMTMVGDLKLDRDGEYLQVTYAGREDIARRLEIYMEMVNYDGSHEAMRAAFKFKSDKERNK